MHDSLISPPPYYHAQTTHWTMKFITSPESPNNVFWLVLAHVDPTYLNEREGYLEGSQDHPKAPGTTK